MNGPTSVHHKGVADLPAEVDVLVVGYGPVGALLAARLGAAGQRVLVVYRAGAPFPLPRAVAADGEVLTLLAEGLRNREIADRLHISDATVKTHVRHVLEKLRFRNRAEAAAFAARHLP